MVQAPELPGTAGLVYEDRGPSAAESADAPDSPLPELPEARLAVSDSEPDLDEDQGSAPDAGVRSILEQLEDGSEADEPEPTQQQQPAEEEPPPSVVPSKQAQAQRRPVWEDPADAEHVVDIAAKSRLRKLRQHDNERTVTGAHVLCLRAAPAVRLCYICRHKLWLT